MIHFNALDFSECRSEEVISFFWRSVYNTKKNVHIAPMFVPKAEADRQVDVPKVK